MTFREPMYNIKNRNKKISKHLQEIARQREHHFVLH